MLQPFIEFVTDHQLNIFDIVILQNGKKLAEHHFQPESRHNLYSATKSILSAAVGMAVDDGLLHLGDTVADLLSEKIEAGIQVPDISALRKVTLERLLTMSVVDYPFRPEGEDWLKYILELPLTQIDTPAFHYTNICAYLAGVMAEKAVKMHLSEYLRTRLFEPLGWTEPEFANCPNGHFYGGSGSKLTVNELSRFGQLYLQNGVYQGVRLLSEKWIKQSTMKQIDCREGGYGYFFWRYARNSYRASGKNGQRCIVWPEKNAVITILSELENEKDRTLFHEAITDFIFPYL